MNCHEGHDSATCFSFKEPQDGRSYIEARNAGPQNLASETSAPLSWNFDTRAGAEQTSKRVVGAWCTCIRDVLTLGKVAGVRKAERTVVGGAWKTQKAQRITAFRGCLVSVTGRLAGMEDLG